MAVRYARLVVLLRVPIVVAWLFVGWWALQQPHVDTTRGGAGLRDLAPVDLPAVQAELRAATQFPVPLHSRILAVHHDPDGFSAAAARSIIERAAPPDEPDPRWPDLLGGIPLINQPPIAGSRAPAGTTAVTYLVFDPETTVTSRTRQAREYANVFRGASGVTGATPARLSTARVLKESLGVLELVTASVIAFAVLIFYRSLVAPMVVLGAIGMAFVVSQAALTAFARALGQEVPREVEPLLVALLLGVVTDYCVFFLSSMRREMRAGHRRRDAKVRAIASASPVVLVASLTVAAGCVSLLLARIDFLAAFGPALAITVLAAAAVALTFVPALVALLGEACFWPSRGRREPGTSRRSGRFGRWLLGRRRNAALASATTLAALVVMAVPVLEMRLGYDAISGLPDDDPSARGQQLAGEGFADGIVAPTVILVEGRALTREIPALVRLQQRIDDEPGVAGSFGAGTVSSVRSLLEQEGEGPALRDPLGLAVTPDGHSARFLAVLDDDPYGGLAVERLGELRARLPQLLEESGLPDNTRATVAGDTAVVLELVDALRSDLTRVAIGVVLLDLLLIAAFLRSVITPMLVVGGSLLAVGAALGVTTWTFQELLGSQGVAFYVPVATLVLLLSLGADYGVFAVGHAWQLARTRPLQAALVQGGAETNGVIAIAGALLGMSFALLALVPIEAFLQFAVAMAVGVLLDTFVIRPILLPASIRLVGEAARWPASVSSR